MAHISLFEIKAYIVYCYMLYECLKNMGADSRNEDIRWQVIKSMLDEFPKLKEKVRRYLKEQK